MGQQMKKFKFNKNDVGSRYDAASDVNCPVDVLVKLAGDKSRVVRNVVGNNPNCPKELKIKLALIEKDLLKRIGVASDSGSPAAVLAKLADDEEFDVRYAVAKNINCPVEVLIKLVSDECSDVHNAVAGNPNCPAALLTKLALGGLGSTVARNINCPVDVLAKLAESNQPYIRIDVTKNKSCPAKVLVMLASDEEHEVRYAVAKSVNCPAGALVKLAADKYHLTRCAVAENTNCPEKLLAKLAKSKIVSVRVAVADNLACPLELLEELACDSSINVRYAVADNPNCTLELMKIALADNHASRKVISDTQPLKLPRQLVRLRKRIESTVKPFVALKKLGDTLPDEFILGSLRERTFAKKLRLWQSKVGGLPYFPKDYKYPTDPHGRPLLLQVQINFADVPKLDMFPEKGILQIYLGDAESYCYGMNLDDGMDQSYFRVLFFPEVIYDKDALVTDFGFLPIDHSNLPCSDIVPIEFDLKYGPISKGDYRFDQLILGGCDEDEAYKVKDAYPERFSGYGSKLGGYPEFVQGDPRGSYQCFPSIRFDRGIWKAKMDKKGWQGKSSEFEFILLLQLDEGFTWGDGGIGNFFIRKADLLKRDFSKVLYDWSCY